MYGAFANPEVGINWQVFRPSKSFALDLIAKYGIAWTKEAATDTRLGNNNVQAGFRMYGDEGRFQWAVQALGQWVLMEDGFDDMWNILARAEVEFEIVEKVGLNLSGNYNFINLSEDNGAPVIYDRSAALGVVIDVQPGVAAIQPYMAYHFQTANGDDSTTLNNNFWQFGVKFGVQF
ncbi:MAG: hypothetical protein FWG18_01920 [Alphaproteobacteria bacterium]|nr:hypothetical protein [Alphaproteobacteria bacterium]